jgi:hypothetical protein
MSELKSSIIVFVLLLGGTGLGTLLRPLLPQEHRRHETLQLVQLVIGMLVTFAALVLGLLTASAKTSFDTVTSDLRTYAAQLIQLDTRLREYGESAEPPRLALRAYTAAAIASTWPREARPPGNYYPIVAQVDPSKLESTELGELLNSVGRSINSLTPHDHFHVVLAADLEEHFMRVTDTRWRLIEEAHGSISGPFFTMLALWLVLIFVSFGLIAPRGPLAGVTILLGAVSISSAVFLIVCLNTPFEGIIAIPSDSMREALAHMSLPVVPSAPPSQ